VISTIASDDGHDLLVQELVTVVESVNMEAGRVEMRLGGDESQPLGSTHRNQTVEFGHTIGIEGIQGTPQGVVIELGRGHPRRNESRRGLIMEEAGDQIKRMIDKPQAIEHHRFDSLLDSEVSHFWGLLGRLIENCTDTEFIEHARNKAEMA